MAIDNGGGSQDYRSLLDQVFSYIKPNNLLEFGLGIGTLYLLEKADKVTSYEVLVNPTQEDWAEEVLRQVGDNPNYKQIVYPTKDEFSEELKTEIENLLTTLKPDFVFVDSGCHCRGQIMNLCFEHNIPNVSAHDTSHHAELYGWDIINPKDGYVKFESLGGQGTLFYTNDTTLIDNLLN